MRRWTSSWCASLVCRSSRSWRWARSARAACGWSTSGSAEPPGSVTGEFAEAEARERAEVRAAGAAVPRRPAAAAAGGPDGRRGGRRDRHRGRRRGPRARSPAAQGAARVVLAVPVGPAGYVRAEDAADDADEVVCLATPRDFLASASVYGTSAGQRRGGRWRCWNWPAGTGSRRRGVAPAKRIRRPPIRPIRRRGTRRSAVPAGRRAAAAAADRAGGSGRVVVFAHGSGSSRHSPRNRYVAGVLNAPAWPRCCSTCSPAGRSTTGPTSSTSSCWPLG